MKSSQLETLCDLFSVTHSHIPERVFSDTELVTLFILIYIYIPWHLPGREKRMNVEFRLGLNKAAAVISHQILISHNLVLGGRGKPLFFCYFHL